VARMIARAATASPPSRTTVSTESRCKLPTRRPIVRMIVAASRSERLSRWWNAVASSRATRASVIARSRPVDYLRVQALLKDAVGLRNAVAHNRFLSNDVYTKGEADLHALLVWIPRSSASP